MGSHCGAFSCFRAWALRCMGFSSCGSPALEHRLNCCGTWAWLLCGMWDPPRPGIKSVSLALVGRCNVVKIEGVTGMKRQIQKAGSDTNKQNICRWKNSFWTQRIKWIWGYSSSTGNRELSASSSPPGPGTVHNHCLATGVSTGDALCLLLLLLDILITLQASIH